MNTEKSKHGTAIAAVGAIMLLLGQMVIMFGRTLGMSRAFDTLGGGNGISDPQRLSANIGVVLIGASIGLGLGVLGLLLICIALFGLRYRAQWLFWFMVIYGGILVTRFPVGTVFGAVLLGFCFMRRREFLAQARTISDT